MKMAQHSLKQSFLDTLDYKRHSLGKQSIYLQTWTINGYGCRTVQGRELNYVQLWHVQDANDQATGFTGRTKVQHGQAIKVIMG